MDYLIIAQELLEENCKSMRLDEKPENSESQSVSDLKEHIGAVKSQVYSNLALCQLKSKNYGLSVINSTKCLSIDAKSIKALFRRGQARSFMKDYDEAIDDFRKALELDPDNQEIKTSVAHCEKQKRDYEKELASNLKRLFT